MLTYNEALHILRQVGQQKKLKPEFILLEDCDGRVLAENIFASENLPICSNSAMDGFLVQVPIQPR